MQIAMLIGGSKILTPSPLSPQELQEICGPDYTLFSAPWVPQADNQMYNGDLMLRDDARLAAAVGCAIDCEYAPDHHPLFVLPDVSFDADQVTLMARFLDGLCAAPSGDALRVVPMVLDSHHISAEDVKSQSLFIDALAKSVDPSRVRFSDTVAKHIKVPASEDSETSVLRNLAIRDIAEILIGQLAQSGVRIARDDAQKKVARLWRKMADASMQICADRHAVFAARVADMILLDLAQNVRVKG